MPFVSSAEEEPNLFNDDSGHGMEERDCEIRYVVHDLCGMIFLLAGTQPNALSHIPRVCFKWMH